MCLILIFEENSRSKSKPVLVVGVLHVQ